MRIDSVVFRLDGQKRVGIRMSPESPRKRCPALLMLHGFPGAEKNTDIARELVRRGWICFLPHFRGSWGSHGRYSFSGILKDTAGFWAILKRDQLADRKKMAILGFSMGGWAALNFASARQDAGSVVALAPMCGSGIWFNGHSRKKVAELSRPLEISSQGGLWSDFKATLPRHDPLSQIANISPRPLLLVHGTKDELVPLELSRRLYRRAGEPKKLVVVKDADHAFTESRFFLTKTVVSWLEQKTGN